MGIGPFTTYAPPGVYTRTTTEPLSGSLLGGLRIPVLIGTGQETLTQTDFEIIRGSSSFADTPIFGEDVAGHWVVGGSPSNPTLGNQNGGHVKFRVRNFPVVDGNGTGRVTFDASKVTVTVNGTQAIVSSVDGTNGIVTLLSPPPADAVVLCSYYFHRKDVRVTDDVSFQITDGSAVLIAPKAETYNIVLGANDILSVIVNDTTTASITLTSGATRTAADIANDINTAAITGLTASTHTDAQGLLHVQLIAQGNIQIGTGSANAALGFNPGDYTNRNKVFRVFNGPIVDGSDGGITTTDPSKVVVLINGSQVLAKAVDGQAHTVELASAPADGSVITIQYYFNTFQDTFDYLPNNNIVSVGNVGISPGRRDFLNGPDFVIVNQGDQSLIQWGTAFQVVPGEKTGTVSLDSTQVVGMLVDNKMYGAQCERYTDPTTATVSQTKFVLPIKPTTGNGRDTPLGSSLYNTITNNRIDLPTNRPDLVTVYVGKSFRDAVLRPAVTVLSVDSVTNTFVLANPVPADYLVFATFYYNVISDDTFTLSVVSSGPSGVGQYTIDSAKTGSLYGVKFGTKTALAETVQWPSGSETLPDAIFTGGGTPVPETVTVTFDNALEPATHASFSNAGQDPYDLYTASRNFGGVVVDGNAPVTVDLSLAHRATLVGLPINTTGLSFLSTDYLVIKVDGIEIAPISLNGLTTAATVVTAINSAIDADTTVHADGSGTFASTAPNNLASSVAYGSQTTVVIKGRNIVSTTNGLLSEVLVMSPVTAGQTNGSVKVGFALNSKANGSYNSLNQPAYLVGNQAAPFTITSGINDNLQLTVDGLDIGVTLPSGSAVSLDETVNAINEAYISVASSADIATFTTDVIALANAIRTAYNAHRVSTTFHVLADSVNPISLGASTDLATAIALLNQAKSAYNNHLDEAGVHQLDDSENPVSTADATDLRTAVALAYDLRNAFNLHLEQKGVHGYDDSVNTVVQADGTGDTTSEIDLVNAIKSAFNAHVVQSGVHITNDSTVATANASDLATAITLANALKTAYNAHLVATDVHVVNDTTNAVVAADATNIGTLTTLANAIKAAFNAHLTQAQGIYQVHGTNDTTNVVTASISELVAKTGAGINSGYLVLTSRTNTVISQVLVKTLSTAHEVLGFTSGASASRTRPTAATVSNALNASSSFMALAVARAELSAGLGNFIEINSRTAGSTSTIAFSAVSNSALITDTGLGIVVGQSTAIGENAKSGYLVTSTAPNGSTGQGFPGQTFTATATGLRFTILKASAGDYSDGGSFTMVVSPNFIADASIPVRAIPGLELTVYNTVNMNAGTTAFVNTYARTGSHPRVGDVFYISYNFAKSDTSTALFRDLKKIQANFGPPTPENPLSLGARLTLLNGAVLVALKQVLRSANGTQAPVGSFTAAIDELRKPIAGNVKPDVITPLATDPTIMAYLNSHCVLMSSPRQEGERTGVFGVAAGTSPLGAQSIAQGLSSELMTMVYPDSFVVAVIDNDGNSTDRLVDGSLMAAALAGSTCSPSIDVATPWTRRQLVGFKSIGRVLDPTEANQTAVKGVTVIEQVDSALRVRHGLTTRVDNVITRTPSVQLTIQFVQQTMRRALDPFIGQKFTNSLLKAVEDSITAAFSGLIEQQIVSRVAGISVSVDENDPTILRTEAVYVPVFPLEYIVSSLNVRISI